MNDLSNLSRIVRKASSVAPAGTSAPTSVGDKAAAAPRKRPRFPKSDRNALRRQAMHAASTGHLLDQAASGALDAVQALRAPRLVAGVARELARRQQHLVLSSHAPTLRAAPNERLAGGQMPLKPLADGRWSLFDRAEKDERQIVRRLEDSPSQRVDRSLADKGPLPAEDLLDLLYELLDFPAEWRRAVTQKPALLPRLAASLEQVGAVAMVLPILKKPALLVPVA
jgi:hypothetical protein